MVIPIDISFNLMGIRIGVASAGGFCAIGLYDTARNLIHESSDMPTDVATVVYGTNAPRKLIAGNYFFAFTADNIVATVAGITSTAAGTVFASIADIQTTGETNGGGGTTLPPILPPGNSAFYTSVLPYVVFTS